MLENSQPATTPPAIAETWDEHTPPPRRGPSPLPYVIRLQPQDPLVGLFLSWAHDGRVDREAVLAEFVGHIIDKKSSGYRLVSYTLQGLLSTPAGRPNEIIPAAALARYRVTTVILQKGSNHTVVLTPNLAGRVESLDRPNVPTGLSRPGSPPHMGPISRPRKRGEQ